MAFQIGEKVVYPNQGVGTVENISRRAFGNQVEPYYLLRLTDNSMTVIIPFSHAGDIGLRRVSQNGELGRVMDFLGDGRKRTSRDWKDRFKVNSEKMRAGGMLEIAEVLKSLLALQRQKPLSFREKKMLDRARQMLVAELSISRGLTEPEAVSLIQKTLAKSALTLPPAR